jgi:putative ABC transport system permease protein
MKKNKLGIFKIFRSPSFKKIIADFFENRSRSFLVIISITIGVFAVGMIGSGYILLTEGMAASYADNYPANITITTDPFDQDLVEMIARQDYIEHVEGRQTILLEVRNPGETKWKKIYVTAIQDLADTRIKLLFPIGQSFVLKDKSIALLEDGNQEINARIGRPLEIKLKDGTTQVLPVAGIVKDYTAGREIIFERKRGYITADTLPNLHAPEHFTTLVMRVSGDSYDQEHIHSIAASINKKVEQSGRTIYSSEIRGDADQPFSNYVLALGQIMLFIGLLIVILSSSLIINTMNALMAQHVRQIGIMKLIGGHRTRIILMYLSLVLIFGLISFLLSVPAGALGGYLMSYRNIAVLNGKLQSTNWFPLFPEVIALQAFVAIFIPLAAALIPILRGSRITVHKALNSQKIANGEQTDILNRLLNRIDQKDLIKKLSLRNTFRKKGRLALTLFALSLGGAMFIAVFNVQLVLLNQIDRIVSYNSADIVINTQKQQRIEKMDALISSIDGIQYVEGWWTQNAQLEVNGETISVSISAPPPDSPMVVKEVSVGRWVLPGELNALAVNDAFYNAYPQLNPGDQITLQIDGRKNDWTVVGIYNYTGFDDKRAYTTPESLIHLGSNPLHVNSFQVITREHDIAYQQEKVDHIQTVSEQHGIEIARIIGIEKMLSNSTDKINLLIFILLLMAFLTGSVGSVGLSGTLSLNVLERNGEIGILRAIGAGDRTISKLVLQEGAIIGIVSYILGVLFSFPVSRVLGTLVSNAIFSAPAEMALTPKGYVFWLILMAIFSLAASLVPARSAARMTIRDVLAYE